MSDTILKSSKRFVALAAQEVNKDTFIQPWRATYAELVALAERMASVYDAPETARLMQYAAEAYRAAGLLRRVEG